MRPPRYTNARRYYTNAQINIVLSRKFRDLFPSRTLIHKAILVTFRDLESFIG